MTNRQLHRMYLNALYDHYGVNTYNRLIKRYTMRLLIAGMIGDKYMHLRGCRYG